MLKEGAAFTVLSSHDHWFGVTYKEDKPAVRNSFRKLIADGVYGEDLYGDLEFSGSFLIYSKAFPAQGRPWGFMWRIGPRLTWKYTKNNSFSLGYMFSHSSNGMRTKNPGHDSFGFSIGFNHNF